MSRPNIPAVSDQSMFSSLCVSIRKLYLAKCSRSVTEKQIISRGYVHLQYGYPIWYIHLIEKNLECTKATTIYLKPENITLSIISSVTYPAPKQCLSESLAGNRHCLTLNSYPTPVEIPLSLHL